MSQHFCHSLFGFRSTILDWKPRKPRKECYSSNIFCRVKFLSPLWPVSSDFPRPTAKILPGPAQEKLNTKKEHSVDFCQNWIIVFFSWHCFVLWWYWYLLQAPWSPASLNWDLGSSTCDPKLFLLSTSLYNSILKKDRRRFRCHGNPEPKTYFCTKIGPLQFFFVRLASKFWPWSHDVCPPKLRTQSWEPTHCILTVFNIIQYYYIIH